jgi:hypothetical protein
MKKIFLIQLSIICLTSGFLHSQISTGEIPIGYQYDFWQNDTILVDTSTKRHDAIIHIDDINNKHFDNLKSQEEDNKRVLYGEAIKTETDFFKNALKYIYNSDTTIWLLKINSQNAFGYQLVFDDFYLPNGCKLFVYNDSHTMKLGAFTKRNNRADSRFVTQHINGNTIILELLVPSNIEEEIKLILGNIVYIYKDIFSNDNHNKDDESCFRYTACPEALGLEEQIKSVALLLFTDGTEWGTCTGTLINKEFNYTDYDKPYLISAAHCIDLFEGEVVFEDCVAVFNFDSNECMFDTNTDGQGQTQSIVGFSEIQKNRDVDFLLLQLENHVGDILEYDISFSGWDRRSTSVAVTNPVYGIHHPLGKSKNIAIAYMTPVTAFIQTHLDQSSTEPVHLELYYDFGNVHEGSSGSALFNSSKMIIGTLFGTGNISPPPGPCDYKPIYYGKFSEAFTRCNLANYLASTTDTEYVNSFSPAETDMSDISELPIEITTSPLFITTTEDFTVKASALLNVSPPIHWYLWINKNPGDLRNYPFGSQSCYSFYQHTGLDGEFESDYFTQFTVAGTYKASLFVYDAAGRQSTTDFSIIIVEHNDPCIYSYIWNNESAKQTVFQKGSSICLYDYCYVWDVQTYVPGDCNEIQLAYSDYIQPKYQGISRIKWLLNDEIKRDVRFNTTVDHMFDTDAPTINQRHYSAFEYQFPQHIVLDHIGLNTIKLYAYGGKMSVSPDAIHFVHPFPFGSDYGPSIASKSFIVVDCDNVWSINETIQAINNNTSAGTILVNPEDDITLNSGVNVNWTAYDKIIINPGFKVDVGAKFIATAKTCPEIIDCDNESDKLEPVKNEKIVKEADITIYPNPTLDFIIVSNANYYCYEIFDSQGRKTKKGQIFSDNFNIDLSNFTPGIYLISFIKVGINNIDKVTKKIVIHE